MAQFYINLMVEKTSDDPLDRDEFTGARWVTCETTEELQEFIQRTANAAKSHFDDVDPEDEE